MGMMRIEIVPVKNPDGSVHFTATYAGIKVVTATREECRQLIIDMAKEDGLTARAYYESAKLGQMALDASEYAGWPFSRPYKAIEVFDQLMARCMLPK